MGFLMLFRFSKRWFFDMNWFLIRVLNHYNFLIKNASHTKNESIETK